MVALTLAAFFPDALGGRGAQLATAITLHTAQNVGIPCAAISAFAIVLSLTLYRKVCDELDKHELRSFKINSIFISFYRSKNPYPNFNSRLLSKLH